MRELIRVILECFFPSRGKHRTDATPTPVQRPAFVRPSVLPTAERSPEAARRRQRRLALVLATVGIDMPEIAR